MDMVQINKYTSLLVYWTMEREIQISFMYPDKLFGIYYMPIYENEVSSKVKVKCTLEQVTKTQRGSRVIALLFL